MLTDSTLRATEDSREPASFKEGLRLVHWRLISLMVCLGLAFGCGSDGAAPADAGADAAQACAASDPAVCTGSKLLYCDDLGIARSIDCAAETGGACVTTGDGAFCSAPGGGNSEPWHPSISGAHFIEYPLAVRLPIQNAWEYSCGNSPGNNNYHRSHQSIDFGAYHGSSAELELCAGPFADWDGVPVLAPCDGYAVGIDDSNRLDKNGLNVQLGRQVLLRCDQTAQYGKKTLNFFVDLIHLWTIDGSLHTIPASDRGKCASGAVKCPPEWTRVLSGSRVGTVGNTGDQVFHHLHMSTALVENADDGLFPLTADLPGHVDPFDLRTLNSCPTGSEQSYPDGIGAPQDASCGPNYLWKKCPPQAPPFGSLTDYKVRRCSGGKVQECRLDKGIPKWNDLTSCTCDALGVGCLGGGQLDMSSVPNDMAVADLSVPPDMAALADLAVPLDMSVKPDLSAPPDMAALPDLAQIPDMATVVDMAKPMELCDGIDNDGNGIVDDPLMCWRTIYRWRDAGTGAECWGLTDQNGPAPFGCNGYVYDREAFIVHATSIANTAEGRQCSHLTDHIIAFDQMTWDALKLGGYDCTLSLGYFYAWGTAPPNGKTPFPFTCPLYRFSFMAMGNGAHLFTPGPDDLTGKTCEPPPRADVMTNVACFGGKPAGC